MKISAYEKQNGNTVKLLKDYENLKFDKLYLAKVFDYTKVPDGVLKLPNIEYNGTGFYYENANPLRDEVEHIKPDYNLYSEEGEYYNNYSIGYTTRGCFRKCSFCVNKKYDKVELHSPVDEFLDDDKKYICCLDDNVLGYPGWRYIIKSLSNTKKYFQFKQGLDLRIMTEEKAEILSNVKYKGDYIFAFDHLYDSELIDNKLQLWRRYCRKTTKLYVLSAFESQDVRDIISVFERIKILFRHQCLPYIMRYKDYNGSEMRGMYINLARWCNQPNIVKKMSFREFCERSGGSTERYMNEFIKQYPDISERYFDMRWEAQ